MARLPISPWPTDSLPHPRFVWPEDCTLDAGGQFVLAEDEKTIEETKFGPRSLVTVGRRTDPVEDSVALSGEIYLEMSKLDLADESSVLAFVRRFGILGVRRRCFQEFRQIGHFEGRVLPRIESQWPAWVRRDFRRALRSGGALMHGETLAEFLFGARVLRDLTTAWRLVSGELSWADAEWEIRSSGAQAPTQFAVAAHFLANVLSDGLMNFHPQIEIIGEALDSDRSRGEFIWLDRPTLYSVCCLELFNHIVEGSPYRRCENDHCRRLFVRQSGGARSGNFRLTGVSMCSVSCARAVANRAYRKRRREARRV